MLKKEKQQNSPVEREAARNVEREPPDHQGEEFQNRLGLLLGRVVLLWKREEKIFLETREREK